MRRRLGALALLAAATPALADDAPPGTFRVASRLFLAPDLPGLYADEQVDFLPLTEMDWLRELLWAEPLLDRVVVHVAQLPSLPAYLFSEERIARRFGDRERVPERFRVEGLVVETQPDGPRLAQFHFRPDVPEPDWIAYCMDPDLSTGQFDFCGVLATYPPDPATTLRARVYAPAPFDRLQHDFGRIADRMREIAYCLDVTEAPPADPEERLAAILAQRPGLTGCGPGLAS